MADGTGTDLSKYATWPPYAGYGEWELTTLENIPGSEDNLINKDQLPSVQYAVRYNPFSDEIPISSWTTGQGIGETVPFLWMASFTYTAIGTLQASYHLWLSTGQCGYFDLTGGPTSAEPTRFGPIPPTFEYSIMDEFKEVMHYGMEGIFTAEVEPTGLVTFTKMEAFYGYMEYICRSRMKSFRLINGNIVSASYISGRGTTGNWKYKLTTNLRNDIASSLDLTNDNVLMTIYLVDNNGTYLQPTFGITQPLTGVKVLSINGLTINVEGPAPTDASKDIPDGWIGAYFTFDKTVLVRDPQTLYADRKVGTSTIPNNSYVTETSLGYETREQQISSGGTTNGIYVLKAEITNLINTKLAAVSVTTPASAVAAAAAAAAAAGTTVQDQVTLYNKQLAFISGGTDSDYGGTLTQIEDLGLIYGEFGTVWGKILLDYMKELSPAYLTLYVGIGGGPTRYHNMHAGCLSGEYFVNTTNTTTAATSTTAASTSTTVNTFRISNQLRRRIYQIETKSRTSTANLVDLLAAMTSPQEFSVSVNSSRMWFINDITYGTGTQGSCDKALFWGNITAITPATTSNPNASITLKIIDVYEKFGNVDGLKNNFLQTITPTLGSVKKWDDGQKEWYLNSRYSLGSYRILATSNATDPDSIILTLKGSLPTSVTVTPQIYGGYLLMRNIKFLEGMII